MHYLLRCKIYKTRPHSGRLKYLQRVIFMTKNIGENISKNLSGKYSQKCVDHAPQFATDALKKATKDQFRKGKI